MGLQVCNGALLLCSFGVAPSSLIVLPTHMVFTTGLPLATIMDNVPIVNIPPFSMCNSLANPAVASATSAACGVLTPMPCVPTIPAPWVVGSPTVLIGKLPALNMSSIVMCAYGGVISITLPGQFKVLVP